MPLIEVRQRYWRKTRKLTGVLLTIWFLATFVMAWYARELNDLNFLGPLGFYMAAQGSLLIFLAVIWYYARYMHHLDLEYGVDEGGLDE